MNCTVHFRGDDLIHIECNRAHTFLSSLIFVAVESLRPPPPSPSCRQRLRRSYVVGVVQNLSVWGEANFLGEEWLLEFYTALAD
jgi:hypothetical protein